ncbi:MAG: ABC transporter permease, partial [Burkholderiaceae bacterium]|nr:ABC transporter permease [Burkholderiaceae bacterium]
MKKISSLSAAQIRTRRGIFTLGISTLLSALVFVVLPKDPQNTSFGFLLGGEWELFRQWDVNSRVGAAIFVIIALACTAYGYFRFVKDKKSLAFTLLGGFSLLMAFLCWAGNGKFIPFTGIVAGGLVLAVPLIFGAMAGVICERSGVINIAIEGQLLAAAFAAGVVASLTKNTWWGLLVAPIAGALISVILATFAI